jgi:hypothetical protein
VQPPGTIGFRTGCRKSNLETATMMGRAKAIIVAGRV